MIKMMPDFVAFARKIDKFYFFLLPGNSLLYKQILYIAGKIGGTHTPSPNTIKQTPK